MLKILYEALKIAKKYKIHYFYVLNDSNVIGKTSLAS